MLLLKYCTERHNSSLVDANRGFGEMLASTQRYYVFGGKGGVGKTSMAASLAVKFANHGEPTLIASTASRSLGDLFEQVSEILCHLLEKTVSLVSLLNVLLVLFIGHE